MPGPEVLPSEIIPGSVGKRGVGDQGQYRRSVVSPRRNAHGAPSRPSRDQHTERRRPGPSWEPVERGPGGESQAHRRQVEKALGDEDTVGDDEVRDRQVRDPNPAEPVCLDTLAATPCEDRQRDPRTQTEQPQKEPRRQRTRDRDPLHRGAVCLEGERNEQETDAVGGGGNCREAEGTLSSTSAA